MTEKTEELTARHTATVEAAIAAVNSRKNWSPFRDSPSAKFHTPGAPEAGKAAFEAQLGQPFDLDQPGILGRSGVEVSPFTRKPLGIGYPVSEPAALVSVVQVLRRPTPYSHPDYPDARTKTPLVVALPADNAALYAEEHLFGPVLFVIAAPDPDSAVAEATALARQHGAISSYLYSTDEDFIDHTLDAYAASGMNLSINLHGAKWANFAAAYSDYHVTGLNPAGNACLADLAFVAGRFRIVQHRRPAANEAIAHVA